MRREAGARSQEAGARTKGKSSRGASDNEGAMQYAAASLSNAGAGRRALAAAFKLLIRAESRWEIFPLQFPFTRSGRGAQLQRVYPDTPTKKNTFQNSQKSK
ncbi:hypothetical protein EYF80_046329 [Liparis tanakae]|uniref:Uncharacterized protein n=1 Tax=Liparis tanakae TaxID=230148 RepID=A0A4Z2FR65_9TELE|nr:hypothetical protein EYF80_046329 [Liparis tanakae]